MKANTRSALTPLDLCTLIAHETVSLLNADAEALDSALRLRTGLDVYAAASELGKEVIPLLIWWRQLCIWRTATHSRTSLR